VYSPRRIDVLVSVLEGSLSRGNWDGSRNASDRTVAISRGERKNSSVSREGASNEYNVPALHAMFAGSCIIPATFAETDIPERDHVAL